MSDPLSRLSGTRAAHLRGGGIDEAVDRGPHPNPLPEGEGTIFKTRCFQDTLLVWRAKYQGVEESPPQFSGL